MRPVLFGHGRGFGRMARSPSDSSPWAAYLGDRGPSPAMDAAGSDPRPGNITGRVLRDTKHPAHHLSSTIRSATSSGAWTGDRTLLPRSSLGLGGPAAY
ncbi:hypothetical protein GCM10027020_31170 [Nocardioides salsibiostraticola]